MVSQLIAAQTYLPKFDVQGHRGARGLKPENTIPAFLTALDYGVTTLELD
ncbi:MAG: glycerophosphodiester phosphodiesterase family protein, partial [Cytophagales bacterium]